MTDPTTPVVILETTRGIDWTTPDDHVEGARAKIDRVRALWPDLKKATDAFVAAVRQEHGGEPAKPRRNTKAKPGGTTTV